MAMASSISAFCSAISFPSSAISSGADGNGFLHLSFLLSNLVSKFRDLLFQGIDLSSVVFNDGGELFNFGFGALDTVGKLILGIIAPAHVLGHCLGLGSQICLDLVLFLSQHLDHLRDHAVSTILCLCSLHRPTSALGNARSVCDREYSQQHKQCPEHLVRVCR